MFHKTRIPIAKLLVDTQNPRLPEMQSNQDEAIRLMIKMQGNKVFTLAQHLASNGTNPANLPIVIPASETQEKYYVLDGNRRLSAIRLLEHPELANDILDEVILQKIKELSRSYKKQPIVDFECVVFSDREQADPWIQLIHRGESQGAGLVRWDGQVAATYDERKGLGKTGTPAALQILDTIKDHKALSQKTRQKIEDGKFPITSLVRLINTPYVRKKIDLNIKNHEVESLEDKTKDSLAQIVEDLGTEHITVSDIKRLEQRIDYADRLSEPYAVPPSQHRDLLPNAPSAPFKVNKKTSREPKPRSTIIPREFMAPITHRRINVIFRELKKIDVNELPNAGAVLLRVFLELSIDHYLEDVSKWSEQQIENSSLAQKLMAIIHDFENEQVMSSRELAPVRKTTGGQTLLAASVKTLHGYVHNKHFSPIPSELKLAWDDLELFVSNLWLIVENKNAASNSS